MTKNKTPTGQYCDIYNIAFLVSLSCVLQISESLIPHPIPGLRLGLANAVTLIALVNLGFRSAFEITVLRTILSSFIMGTFMSPAFALSFSAGVLSVLVMGFLYWLSSFHKHYRFSIVGISIAGALTHNIAQLYLAYFILVKHLGIFVFMPWLAVGALIMGWITGLAAGRVCLELKQAQEKQRQPVDNYASERFGLAVNHYLPGTSLVHKMPAQVKIIAIFVVSLAVLVCNSFWFYLGLFLFLGAVMMISLTPLVFLFARARRYAWLMAVSFLFPVFFNSGKHVISQLSYLKITSEGLNMGVIFALRILFLILASALLIRTTSPKDLTDGLSRLLSPLKPLGISGKRTAAILSLSWVAVPVFWDMAKNRIRGVDFKQASNPRNLIRFLSDLIAKLYLETGGINTIWEGDRLPESFLRKEAGKNYLRDDLTVSSS